MTRHNEPGKSTFQIVESETGRLVRSIALPATRDAVAWSPDGATLATSCDESKIDLWDAATGIRKAILEGSTNHVTSVTFDPSGTLLASNGWERRLRIWDAVLGRPLLSLTGSSQPDFSQDGRIVVSVADQLTAYQVDPAFEYRTFALVFGEPVAYSRASIRGDGRMLALAMNRGVALWDLARGTELPFLPIGMTLYALFDTTGDLLTLSPDSHGVLRWPVRLDPKRREFCIGPPHQLPLPAAGLGIAEDPTGRIVAMAYGGHALVSTPDRTLRVGPLDDCRYVAISPDGQWLATGSHERTGFQVWSIRDGERVVDRPVEGIVEVAFSPDGKWLMTSAAPSRLWTVGTWKEARTIGGVGYCFSPDGRNLLVQEANMVLRLVEVETGRTVAKLESPDLCGANCATFTPVGSRLAVVTQDGPAVHVWDLRAIRKHLREMGLDWDAPAYSVDDPAGPSAPPLPTLNVEFGRLRAVAEEYNSHLEQNAVPAEDLVARCTELLQARPNDLESLHQRGHAFYRLGRFDQALADFSAASTRHPRDVHLRAYRGICLFNLKQYAAALDQLESAFQTEPETVRAILDLDEDVKNQAWVLVTGPKPGRDPALGARLAAFAVALAPDAPKNLNTLGVAIYRAGKFTEAITTLEKSLEVGYGRADAFDLSVMAMAHHQLGHREKARGCYDRAVRWLGGQQNQSARDAMALAAFRAEAEAVLAGAAGELPANAFAPLR